MQGDTMPLGPRAPDTLLKGLMPFAEERSRTGEYRPASQGIAWPALTADKGTDRGTGMRALAGASRARPRIVFVLMSAVAQPSTVDQLAQALAPHRVLVHHDFSQSPHFALQADNVRFVPNPMRTGWAQFGFVEGIFHSLQHALKHLEFDYLQLLSPSCLPIKPLAAFERHISGLEEAHFDCIELLTDKDARMSVGYRAWTDSRSLMHRLMRRLSTVYFDSSPGRRDEAGVWIRSGAGAGLSSHVAGLALQALSHPALGRHLREQALPLYYGSTWFGARRHLIAGMVRTWLQPGVQAHFRQVHIAEEFLVPSLLMKLRPHKGPMNHLIERFEQAHPGTFGLAQLEELRHSPAFFARKFPDDAQAPVRQQVLTELAQANLAATSAYPAYPAYPTHTVPSTATQAVA